MLNVEHLDLQATLKSNKSVEHIVCLLIDSILIDVEKNITNVDEIRKVIDGYRTQAQAIAKAAATGFAPPPKPVVAAVEKPKATAKAKAKASSRRW